LLRLESPGGLSSDFAHALIALNVRRSSG